MNESQALTHEELRLIFVGPAEREAKEKLESGRWGASDARLRVGLAESTFQYLMEVADEQEFDFVRRADRE